MEHRRDLPPRTTLRNWMSASRGSHRWCDEPLAFVADDAQVEASSGCSQASKIFPVSANERRSIRTGKGAFRVRDDRRKARLISSREFSSGSISSMATSRCASIVSCELSSPVEIFFARGLVQRFDRPRFLFADFCFGWLSFASAGVSESCVSSRRGE